MIENKLLEKRAAAFGYDLNIDWREVKLTKTEALAVGVKAGLKLERMMAVMKATMAFNHPLYVAMPKKACQGDDSPGFAVNLAGKDVRLAVELAKAYGFDALVRRAAQESLDRAGRIGHADADEGFGPGTVGPAIGARPAFSITPA